MVFFGKSPDFVVEISMDRDGEDHQLELDFTEAPSLTAGKKALNDMLFRCYLRDVQSENPRLRRKGAKGLGSLGASARNAVLALESLLRDPDRKVREAARAALVHVRV
jgi:hypothetical protein